MDDMDSKPDSDDDSKYMRSIPIHPRVDKMYPVTVLSMNTPWHHDTYPVLGDSIGIPPPLSTLRFDDDIGVILVCQLFRDKSHLQRAVQKYHVMHAKREFCVYKSDTKRWLVRCKHAPQTSCTWILNAHFKVIGCKWEITHIGPQHTCDASLVSEFHCNLSETVVAHELIGLISKNPGLSPNQVQQLIQSKYGFEVNYMKARLAIQRATEMVYGTLTSEVANLPPNTLSCPTKKKHRGLKLPEETIPTELDDGTNKKHRPRKMQPSPEVFQG